MSKARPEIDSELRDWIAQQKIFFVASAPSTGGHINCSPKGGDSFRVIDSHTVIYQDYTGSGAETIAHVRENERIIIMFCEFVGSPRVLRLHGTGSVFTPGSAEFYEAQKLFPENPGTRTFIRVAVTRISTSCGYSVPFMEFRGNRDTLDKYFAAKGPEKTREYWREKNSRSIDDLPALETTNNKLPTAKIEAGS